MIGFDVTGFILSWLVFFSIYSILAISLNLETGLTGMANFGKVAFYALGAYFTGYVSIELFLGLHGLDYPIYSTDAIVALGKLSVEQPSLNLSVFLLTLVGSFLFAGIIGFLIMLPALRVGPAFFGITVLSFGEMLRIFLRHYKPVGATYGLVGIPHPLAWVGGGLPKDLGFALISLSLLAITYIYAQRITNSPLGRLLKAIRDDETAILYLGKNVPLVKGKVLFIGSGMAGVAGCLYAYYLGSITPNAFMPAVTFEVWAMMLLGGVGNNKGSILGAAIITFLDRSTAALNFLFPNLIIDPNFIRWMLVGVIIVVVLLFKPEGIIKEEYVWTPAWRLLEAKAEARRKAFKELIGRLIKRR